MKRGSGERDCNKSHHILQRDYKPAFASRLCGGAKNRREFRLPRQYFAFLKHSFSITCVIFFINLDRGRNMDNGVELHCLRTSALFRRTLDFYYLWPIVAMALRIPFTGIREREI